MTTKPEALRLAVASGAMADEGQMIHLLSWVEIRNLLRADAAELRRQHAEIERLQAERDALLSALQGMNEAYCRAGFSLTKAERHEDRMRLIASRAAISTATGAAA